MANLQDADAGEMRRLLHREVATSPRDRAMHRLHAVLLVANGVGCPDVARWFDDSPRSVERWVQAFASSGLAALGGQRPRGRPARIDAELMNRIDLDLGHPPIGAPGWTAKMLQDHLSRSFGVRLGVRQCQRTLARYRLERLASTPGATTVIESQAECLY